METRDGYLALNLAWPRFLLLGGALLWCKCPTSKDQPSPSEGLGYNPASDNKCMREAPLCFGLVYL